jgi:hypothetical protein
MFCIFSTYPQLWIKLLTTLKFGDSKRSFCQGFFCNNLKIFYVEISMFYFLINYTANPRLWTTYSVLEIFAEV